MSIEADQKFLVNHGNAVGRVLASLLEGRRGDGVLDRKTQALVTIALLSVMQQAGEVATHITVAKNAGCVRDEIIDAILITSLYRVPASIAALKIAIEEMNRIGVPARSVCRDFSPRLIDHHMEVGQSLIRRIRQEGGDIGAEIGRLVDTIYSESSLEDRTRELIFIAIFSALGISAGIKSHMPRAKKAGCTKSEIVSVMMQASAHSGISGLVTCLPTAVIEMDRCEIR